VISNPAAASDVQPPNSSAAAAPFFVPVQPSLHSSSATIAAAASNSAPEQSSVEAMQTGDGGNMIAEDPSGGGGFGSQLDEEGDEEGENGGSKAGDVRVPAAKSSRDIIDLTGDSDSEPIAIDSDKEVYQEIRDDTLRPPPPDPSKPNDYIVERIIGMKESKRGGKKYLVKWFGYWKGESTWEHHTHLHCTDVVEYFLWRKALQRTRNTAATTTLQRRIAHRH
jgi:hypothetical protein